MYFILGTVIYLFIFMLLFLQRLGTAYTSHAKIQVILQIYQECVCGVCVRERGGWDAEILYTLLRD